MIKYISALSLALFSLSAVAQNVPAVQAHSTELQHVLVAQTDMVEVEEVIETEAAPGSPAGGVSAYQIETPVVIGVVGAAALAAMIASSSGGSSTSHH